MWRRICIGSSFPAFESSSIRSKDGTAEGADDGPPWFPVEGYAEEPRGRLHVGDTSSTAAPRADPSCRFAAPHFLLLVYKKAEEHHSVSLEYRTGVWVWRRKFEQGVSVEWMRWLLEGLAVKSNGARAIYRRRAGELKCCSHSSKCLLNAFVVLKRFREPTHIGAPWFWSTFHQLRATFNRPT